MDHTNQPPQPNVPQPEPDRVPQPDEDDIELPSKEGPPLQTVRQRRRLSLIA